MSGHASQREQLSENFKCLAVSVKWPVTLVDFVSLDTLANFLTADGYGMAPSIFTTLLTFHNDVWYHTPKFSTGLDSFKFRSQLSVTDKRKIVNA